MDDVRLEIRKELEELCKIPNSISGISFGCAQIYVVYKDSISKIEFLNILKGMKDDKGNLEFVIKLFERNEKEVAKFIESNKEQIMGYRKLCCKEKKDYDFGL